MAESMGILRITVPAHARSGHLESSFAIVLIHYHQLSLGFDLVLVYLDCFVVSWQDLRRECEG